MGDLVLIQPMIRLLSTRFGTPVDILASGGWVRPLYQGQPGVGEILVLRRRKLPFWLSAEKQALVAYLRAQGPRPVWYCDSDERLLPLLARAGLDDQHLLRARQLPILDNEHLVDWSQRLASTLPSAWCEHPGSKPDTPPQTGKGQPTPAFQDPTLQVSDPMQADLTNWLAARGWTNRPLLLLQAGNRRTMRTGLRRRMATNTKWWPEERWAVIIRMLASLHPQAVILLVGAPPEVDLNEELLRQAQVDNAFNVAGDLPIPRLIALQARAAGMISVDTGPAHTAAAVGCPLVVLFGIADPVRISPRGGVTPIRVLRGEHQGQAHISAIQTREVVNAWQALPLRLNGHYTEKRATA